ncbi:epoxide hydrolase family protein [Actinomadura luteofluorescens]|uniref:epoxide hydrolase family protein n=1 Tax=Actinomadura luteofluorescens TaxID=46163 RepID=UPI0036437AB1
MTNEIRPFRIDVPAAEIECLRARVSATRWLATAGPDDWSRGVPAGYLRELAAYWADGFDWRAEEAALNEIPHFRTEIDGQTVHFFHARSPEPEALPIVLTHGWPSSPVEFMKVVGPLTDPRAHGGDPADAFHVVLPSLPGYGFSNPIGEAGFNLFGVARMWAELMRRLGYERYVAQGTDVGSGVAGMLPLVAPERVAASTFRGRARPRRSGPPLSRICSPEPIGTGRGSSTGSGRRGPATWLSSRPARRPWRTPSTTRRSASWPGSWRRSTSGRTRRPASPTTRWTGTSSSPT